MQFLSTAFLFTAIANAYTGSFFASIDDGHVQLQLYTSDRLTYIGDGPEDLGNFPLLTMDEGKVSYTSNDHKIGKRTLGLIGKNIVGFIPSDQAIPLKLNLNENNQVTNLVLETCEGEFWHSLRKINSVESTFKDCTYDSVYFFSGLA